MRILRIIQLVFFDLLHYLISLPFLPILYFQAKRIRKKVPLLPEAIEPNGIAYSTNQNEKEISILALGESTMAGVGVTFHKEGLAGTFAKEWANLNSASVSWSVYARSGYTAQKVHQKLIPKIEKSNFDIIIISLGANDAFKLKNVISWQKDIQKLIHTLRSLYPNATIAFFNMPPIQEFPAFSFLMKFIIGKKVNILGRGLFEVAKMPNVFYFRDKITLDTWVLKMNKKYKDSDFFSDGIHPSKLTYQTWAKEMALFLFEKLN
jgi:lysophospholipase L1-like esterase